jgi:hypothetical protein
MNINTPCSCQNGYVCKDVGITEPVRVHVLVHVHIQADVGVLECVQVKSPCGYRHKCFVHVCLDADVVVSVHAGVMFIYV